MSDAHRAEERKAEGNKLFTRGYLGAAIEAYSEAITFDPSQSVYYTNRAMCFRKKAIDDPRYWNDVISDCTTALNLEGTSIKGHYLLGVALDAVGGSQSVDAVGHLHRALELCKDQTVSYKEDIQRAMLGARKRQWEAMQAGSVSTLAATEQAVQGILQRTDEVEAAMVTPFIDTAFADARSKLAPRRVPDYFTCRITLEIMLDPVVTPDGITYERSALTQHLAKNGNFDPVTRRPFEPSRLASNLALKEAINAFLEENPWAYECTT